MTVESATYISDLNATYPASSDQKSEGDDHLRLVKSTVKATFPNITGAVSATHTQLNYVTGVTSAIQTQIDAKASLASPTFTGTPAAPTATVTDNSTKVATTAFVRSVGTDFSSVNGYSTNTVLTTSNYGQFLYVSGTMTLTLPVADATNINRAITCYCYTTGTITVATQSSQTLYYQGVSTTTSIALMRPGDVMTFVNYNGSAWMAVGANSIGTGQTWASSASTTAGTTYTNNTGKPIVVNVSADLSGTYQYLYITVNGVNVRGATGPSGAGYGTAVQALIPANTSWSFNVSGGTPAPSSVVTMILS